MYRLVVCLLLTLPLPSQQTAPQIDPALRPALELHRANNFEAASREYRSYLKTKPSSVEARSNLGAVLAALGRYEEAIAEYKLALDHAPANPGVRFNYGLALYKSGRFDDAAGQFSEANRLYPGNKQVLLLLADCHLRRGANDKVIELLEPLNKTDENDLSLAYLLGTALIRTNEVARGEQVVNRILRNGESAEARLLLGTTKMMAREFAEALTDIAKAAELNPKLPAVHAYHGLALLQTGDSPNALIAFRKELASNPNDFDSNLNVGALLRQEQSYDDARAHLEKALTLRPGHAAVRYQLAALDLATGEVERARTQLEELTKAEPNFVEAHVTLATVYYRLKRKADGDRERAIVQKLNDEIQAQQPGVQPQQEKP